MTLLLHVISIIACVCFVTGQSQCTGRGEKCVLITNCYSLLELTIDPSPANRDKLRRSSCGQDGVTPMVCCPALQCYTSAGVLGICIDQSLCRDQNTTHLTSCNGIDTTGVCCPTEADNTLLDESKDAEPNYDECTLTALPPNPESECCGVDANGAIRIYGGSAAELEEYPWLALIKYVAVTERDMNNIFICGGSLISGQYVLTAAHCITGRILKHAKPVAVVLGEYDIKEDKDCTESAGGGINCSDDPVVVPIETLIPHPGYNTTTKFHDIALIKLRDTVTFTDFIRPICLPTEDFTLNAKEHLDLLVAGWGATEDRQYSTTKQYVSLPYVDIRTCHKTVYPRKTLNYDSQICAGGEDGKDACRGDSGGPLMYERGRTFEIVGIVNFGLKECAQKGKAAVYANVFHYVDWILDVIKNIEQQHLNV